MRRTQSQHLDSEIFAVTPPLATSHPGEFRLSLHTDTLGTTPVRAAVTGSGGTHTLSITLLGDRLEQAIDAQDVRDPQRFRCAVHALLARYLSSAAFEARLRDLAQDLEWDWRVAA